MNPTIEQIRAANVGIWTCPAEPTHTKPDPRFIPITAYGEAIHPDQFICPKCHELAWRTTQRMAHVDEGDIACSSCVIDAATLPDGTHWTEAVISRFRIRVPENSSGIRPGVWRMTSRHMPLV